MTTVIVLGMILAILLVLFFAGWLTLLFDDTPLQPTWQETLARRADEQHAAIMAGDERLGTYGNWPPSEGI